MSFQQLPGCEMALGRPALRVERLAGDQLGVVIKATGPYTGFRLRCTLGPEEADGSRAWRPSSFMYSSCLAPPMTMNASGRMLTADPSVKWTPLTGYDLTDEVRGQIDIRFDEEGDA